MEKTSGPKRGVSKEGGGTRDRATAGNNKSEGLTEELIKDITDDKHNGKLLYLLKLHELNQKVRRKNANMQDKIDKLQVSFKHLG